MICVYGKTGRKTSRHQQSSARGASNLAGGRRSHAGVFLNAGDSARLWQYVGGKRKRERIRRLLAALERRGFIDMNKHGGETRIALSRDGKRIALAGNIEKISLPRVKHWDQIGR